MGQNFREKHISYIFLFFFFFLSLPSIMQWQATGLRNLFSRAVWTKEQEALSKVLT